MNEDNLIGPSIGHYTTDMLISNKFFSHLRKLSENKINIVQLFIDLDSDKNNSLKQHKNMKILDAYLKKIKVHTIIHSSYKHNLSKQWNNNSWWITNIITEIKLASIIGSKAIVLHTGKQMKLKKEQALNNMYTSLLHIYAETCKYKSVKILIETAVGQGSELLSDITHFGNFYKKLADTKDLNNRFGICLDTCHIFAAGYDIRTKKKLKQFLNMFDKYVGLNNIALIHLNDSYNELNSKIDRHQILGKGYIGDILIGYFVDYFKKNGTSIITETPARVIKDQIDEINKIL